VKSLTKNTFPVNQQGVNGELLQSQVDGQALQERKGRNFSESAGAESGGRDRLIGSSIPLSDGEKQAPKALDE
jgi:hypothetical protein